jgi:COMPASS component SPP1
MLTPASLGKEGTPASNRTSMPPGRRSMGPSSGESSDAGEYCLCRGPDDHRMMVCCEGGCDEWYHCSCVGIDETDAKELLDVYICPKCHTTEKFTTWKRMCRYFNVGNHLGEKPCRKAARVDSIPPSKYCSEECKKKFWAFVKSQLRDDDEPTKARLPKKEGADPSKPYTLFLGE